MSLGLLFPGQGTQHAVMLPWLDGSGGSAASQSLALLESTIGRDWRARLTDAAWATSNQIAQPLLTGVCLAAWERLQPLLPAPAVVAGYSVGGFAGFCAAGVFDRGAALALAAQRARVMDDCVAGVDTGLSSVTAAPPGLIAVLCRDHRLDVAIRLGVDRAILGGLRADLLAAERDALAAGATCTPVGVTVASHTHWLTDGVPRLAAAMAALPFARPHATLVCNHGGVAVRQVADLRHALATQIANTVSWDRCMETMAERGVRCVLEVGPGTTLSRMWNAAYPDIPARSADEFQVPESAVAWVRCRLAER